MSNFEGKYFITNNKDLIIRIKETHYQPSTAVSLVEVDDWAGDFNLPFNNWYLKNKSMMVETTDIYLQSLKEVFPMDFKTKLVHEINKSIEEIKKGNTFCKVGFKQTDKRIEILRKYYGNKP